MTREDEEPRVERAIPDSPRGRLKGSVEGYHEPFEPMGVEDWEVLGLEDDMGTTGDGA